MKCIPILCLLCLAVVVGPAGAQYEQPSSVIGAAGGKCASAGYRHAGPLGQPTPVGAGASAGYLLYAGFWEKVAVATGVMDHVIPEMFRNVLLPNLPNPFAASTAIRFSLPAPGNVELRVFDVSGRLVRTLAHGERREAGPQQVVWDGTDSRGKRVTSGVYFYRVDALGQSAARRMVRLK